MFKLLRRIVLVAIIGGMGVWLFFAVKNRELSINHWFVRGQQMGVDVSSYQEDVDFGQLARQGVKFAYIKATEGSAHVDESFNTKWADAKAENMPAGAYHFFSYESSGATQAQNFIKTVGDLTGRLIPAVDMELSTEQKANPPEKADVVEKLKAFLAIVEENYHVKPLIYAQQDYYDKYLKDDFSDYPRWVRNVYYPAWVDVGEHWLVWQYSDRGELEGYGGEKYIDLNVVNGVMGLDSLKVK